MNLLHVDSSISGPASASRKLSAAVVERFVQGHPGIQVVHRDLAAAPLPHFTMDSDASEEAEAVVAEFLAADVVVIGSGLYNFSIPSQLKAWIDRVMLPGRTFRFENGQVTGLVPNKRAIVTFARGATYGASSPFAAMEHGETLLRACLAYIGITEPDVIVADGLRMGDELATLSMAAALKQALAIPLNLGPQS